MPTRIDYRAEKFGYVGWEVITEQSQDYIDVIVLNECKRLTGILNESVIVRQINLLPLY